MFYIGGFLLLAAVCTTAFLHVVKKNMPRPNTVSTSHAVGQPVVDAPVLIIPPKPDDDPVPAPTPEPVKIQTPADIERARRLEALVKPWQDAMDDNEDNAILRESLKLINHADPEARAKAVEGLRWLGPKGMVGLANMMYDHDPDIAKDAAEGWIDEMRDMDDDDMKAALLDLATQNVDALDEDTFTDLMFLFLDLPEHLAATKLLAILKSSNNPDYIEEILQTLHSVVLPDEHFETKAKTIPFIEAWLKDPANFDKPKEKDDE